MPWEIKVMVNGQETASMRFVEYFSSFLKKLEVYLL